MLNFKARDGMPVHFHSASLRRILQGFALLIVLALPASAAPSLAQQAASDPLPPLQPFRMTGFYSVYWSGLSVGKLVVNAYEDDHKYNLQAFVKAKGMAYSFTKHESVNKVEGVKSSGRYIPQRFETVFKLRKDTRHIILHYDKQGNLVKEDNQPPENRKKRPEVPIELKRNVLDVMSVLFYQRGELYKALQTNQPRFTYRMYDGRRLTDLIIHMKGRQTISWRDAPTKVITFGVERIPIAGFKKSELEDLAKDNDPNIEFYLSDDGKLIPLKIVIDAQAGAFFANFDRDCESLEACVKQLD